MIAISSFGKPKYGSFMACREHCWRVMARFDAVIQMSRET